MKKAAKNFYDTLKDNPEAIIAWAESEIRAYQELIKLVKKEKKK